MLFAPQLDDSSRIPHYVQIYEQIKRQIIAGGVVRACQAAFCPQAG